MQEFDLHYQLVKEDYLDWIHWNVARHSMKKMKIITAVIFVAFALVYVGSSFATKKDPISLGSTLLVVALLGVFMFYIISPRHQERTIWKRSGLQKLEKTNGFPRVNLSAGDKSVTMEVPDQFCKEYYFPEITEWEETERLFLMGTTEKTWQFIAKSAFDSEETKSAFKEFMIEKIADAKENPEKYEKEEAQAEVQSEALEEGSTQENISYEGGDVKADEVVIQHVDTSSMGKIGQMAHLMAALAPEESESGETLEKETEEKEIEEKEIEEKEAKETEETAADDKMDAAEGAASDAAEDGFNDDQAGKEE